MTISGSCVFFAKKTFTDVLMPYHFESYVHAEWIFFNCPFLKLSLKCAFAKNSLFIPQFQEFVYIWKKIILLLKYMWKKTYTLIISESITK